MLDDEDESTDDDHTADDAGVTSESSPHILGALRNYTPKHLVTGPEMVNLCGLLWCPYIEHFRNFIPESVAQEL